MRRRSVVAVLVVIIAGLVVTGAFSGAGDDPEPTTTAPEVSLVTIAGDYQLWPYTSRTESPEGQTLAINVVFRGDAAETRQALRESELGWDETDEQEAPDDPDQADQVDEAVAAVALTDWEEAHGSNRYSYFEREGEGQWVEESYQLHAGTYLGTRYHIRGYEAPDDTYTAVQIHSEYYDWFRLRHTVTEIDDSARMLEDEFIEANATVTREYHAIEGGWSDGWLSVIELMIVLPMAGALLHRRTRMAVVDAGQQLVAETNRHDNAIILGAGLAAVYLAIRGAGIGLESAFPGLHPKAIALPLYVVLAFGLPALAAWVGSRCASTPAFLGATFGMALGFLADFANVGATMPPDLVAHRIALAGALGLIAAGRADVDNRLVVAGLCAWALGLALPLADVI